MRIHQSKPKVSILERIANIRFWAIFVALILATVVLTHSASASLPPSAAKVGIAQRSPGNARPLTCTPDFSLLTSYPVGTGPASVAVGDFNNDGFRDLAVADANGGSNDVSVLLGDGSGGFGAANSFGVGLNPSSVAAADFNHDGNMDLVTANAVSNDVSVLLGDGSGGFSVTSGFFAGNNPQSVAVGDFNEDGELDLAIADKDDNQVTILFGDGSGAFSTLFNFGTGTYPRSVAVGDFNEDGHLDLAVANGGSNDVSVLLGDGGGDFGLPTNSQAGTNPYSVAAGDFNEDNHLDIAVANSGSENLSVLLGDGGGGFTPAPDVAAPGNPSSVVVADFNSDGHPDLEYTASFNNVATVLSGDGTGNFNTITAISFSAGPAPQHSVAADFDGDGKPDLAFANSTSNEVSVALNRCTSQVTPTATPAPSSCFPSATNYSTGGNPNAVAVADFNRDGYQDLVVSKPDTNNIAILFGNSSGGFGAPVDFNFLVGFMPYAFAVGELNGDGYIDLAVANNNSNSVTVLLGNGSGGFAPPSHYATGSGPTSVAMGDFEGDGDLDLAVANYANNSITLLRNDGTGHFPASLNRAAGPGPYSVVVADVNGDNRPELAWVCALSGDFFVAMNDGSGNFGAGFGHSVGSSPQSIAVGDLDGDGHPDLVTANSGSDNVSVLQGNGNGSFGNAVNFPAGSGASSVAINDLNNDGHLDLSVANTNSNTVSVLFGDGSGNFGPANPTSVGLSPVSVAVGDFDGNGGLDLVTANSSSSNVSVLLNQCPPTATPTPAITRTPTIISTSTSTFTPAVTASPTCLVEAVLGQWTPVATYTVTVNSPAIATDGTYLYAMGGTDGSSNIDLVQRYDPVANTWLSRAPMPQRIYAARAAYAGVTNKIYVFGGYNPSGQVLNTVYVYDIASNTWSTGANMPSVRFFANVSYYNGNHEIYVIGGRDNLSGTEQNQTWVYDPLSNTWNTPRANIPVPMSYSATTIVGQYIYLMGSFGGGGGTYRHLRYDIVNDTWTTRAPLPALTFLAAAGAVGNTVVLFGGGTPVQAYNTTYLYDIATDSWRVGPNMTSAHAYAGGAAVGNRLIVVGGWTGSVYTNLVETTLVNGNCVTPTPTPVTCDALNFAPAINYPVQTAPGALAEGDFNRDGNLDIAVTNTYPDSVSLLLGNGSGGFGTAANFGVGQSPHSVAVGDFNHDGNLDLVTANSAGQVNTVSVLLGNGSGGFGPATDFTVGVLAYTYSVAVGDFNHDGNLDLVTANRDLDNVSMLLGNGSGGFGSATNFSLGLAPPLPADPWSVAVGDFNRDGNADLAVANHVSNTVAILLGNGSGGFAPATHYSVGASGPTWVVVGDFNRDGNPDVATSNVGAPGATMSVLLGNGLGGFDPPLTFGTGSFAVSLAVADFNGDGNSDLVASHYNANTVTVFTNSGTPNFGSEASFAVGSRPLAVLAADFNHDGRIDLATANSDSGDVSVLLNACTSGPTDTPTITPSLTRTLTPTFTLTPPPTNTPTSTSTPTPNPCTTDWQIIGSPNLGAGSNFLYSMAAVSSNEVWAVGEANGQALVERWNGGSWIIDPSAGQGNGSVFHGVAAVGSNNVWAVGNYLSSGNPEQTLIERRGGIQWSVVSSPNQGSDDNFLFGVTAVSTNDVWAVGYYYTGILAHYNTLIEHWDGTAWSIVPSPNQDIGNFLYGVAAVSSTDVWAVGRYTSSGGIARPLVEHWNGTAWSIASSADPGGGLSVLSGVAAVNGGSGTLVVAVGSYLSGGFLRTLVEVEDQGSFGMVPSSNPGGGNNELAGVVAVSSDNVWAVGEFTNSSGREQTLIEAWGGLGTAWVVEPSPNQGSGYSDLSGVTAVNANDIWAVGFYGNGSGADDRTLIMRAHPYGCTTPTATSTRTPTNSPTITPTRTNTPLPVLVGHVTWQGNSQPNANNAGITATLTLCVAGSPQTFVAPTNNSGTFTLTLGLAPGQYNWQIKGVRNLSNAGSLTLSTGTTNFDFGLLRAGDANNNNTVNTTDFNVFRNQFGQSGSGRSADFNNDGVVNTTDFNLLRNNFGQSGSLLICP